VDPVLEPLLLRKSGSSGNPIVQNLYRSIPRRIAAVLKGKVGPTLC
jgi:hypothetical protein